MRGRRQVLVVVRRHDAHRVSGSRKSYDRVMEGVPLRGIADHVGDTPMNIDRVGVLEDAEQLIRPTELVQRDNDSAVSRDLFGERPEVGKIRGSVARCPRADEDHEPPLPMGIDQSLGDVDVANPHQPIVRRVTERGSHGQEGRVRRDDCRARKRLRTGEPRCAATTADVPAGARDDPDAQRSLRPLPEPSRPDAAREPR